LRPTTDRVRGAIFSSLGGLVAGSRVLDLFAGSGAMGIEALSRGAAAATFVESHARCAGAISRNLLKTRQTGKIIRQDVFTFLARWDSAGAFDLIFADPPYRKNAVDRNFTAELLDSVNLPKLLAPGGLLILEQAPDDRLFAPHPWECIRRRKYGSTETLFLRSNGLTADDPA
jgi:16S rRNA (guanine966-N2)-methyltransferase